MRWVEIPIEVWLRECVLVSDSDVTVPELDELAAVELNFHQKGEMCPGLQKLFNSWLVKINCDAFSTFSIEPESHADETASYSTDPQRNADRPDLVVYPTNVAAAKRAYELPSSEKKTIPADFEDQRTSSAVLDTPSRAPSDAAGSPERTDLHAQGFMTPLQGVETGPNASAARARMSWDWADLLIEVEPNEKRFPWTASALDLQSEEAQEARGQLVEYAAEIMGCQHRTFLFMVVVCGVAARLVRFDRNGALVSTSFDYMRKSSAFGRFLYGLYGPRRSRKARGYDPTATLASDEDALLLRKACELFSLAPESAQYRRLKESAMSDSPIYKLSITARWSEDGGPVRKNLRVSTKVYLVGRPLQLPQSIMGKGTRPFVACDLEQLRNAQVAADENESYNLEPGAIVFIKDYWRVDSPEVMTEQEVYHCLWKSAEKAKVQMFPTPVGAGDVSYLEDNSDTEEYSDEGEADESSSEEDLYDDGNGLESEEDGHDEDKSDEENGDGDGSEEKSDNDGFGNLQMTLTQHAMSFADGEQPLQPRIHTRLIFKEVCRPLKEFKDPIELLYVIYCAINAHRHAWESADILHRDVSAGNIMIYDQLGDSESTAPPLGLLSDWDFAKTKDQLKGPATQTTPSGTWQFMSALLQHYPNWPHGVPEDLESFMHLLNWCILKYFEHRLSSNPDALASFLRTTYDESHPPADTRLGHFHTASLQKLLYVKGGFPFVVGLPVYRGPEIVSSDDETSSPQEVDIPHPLAKLVGLLSNLFKEHYDTLKLPDIDAAFRKLEYGANDPENPIPKQSTTRGWNLDFDDSDSDNSDSTEDDDRARSPLPPRIVVRSTPAETQKVSPVHTHKAILEAFRTTLRSKYFEEKYNSYWPNFAKTPDQCPYYATSTVALAGITSSRVTSSNNSSRLTTGSGSSSAVEGDDEPSSKRRRTEMDGRGLEVPQSGSVGHHAPRQPSPLSIPGNNSALGEGSGQGAAIPEAGPSTAAGIRLGAKRTREY